MSSLSSRLETILFVASKPLSVKKMAAVLKVKEDELLTELQKLQAEYNTPDSGIILVQNNSEWQMLSHPDNREAAENFLKAEVSGELTRPQLETLTVIAYYGPITKPELEQIRGVNCSLILRNLMLRGLVKEVEDLANLLPMYEATMDFVRRLGIGNLAQLPNYEELHKHEYIVRAVENHNG